MQTAARRWLGVARHAADAVPAILLAAMFVAFIVQVFMRYVMDRPVGWTVEICVIAWIWVILWGQSLSAREEDEIRFDIIYGSVSPAFRRGFRLTFSAFLVVIYAWSLPDVVSYVSFMKIEKTSYLDIPYNYVFSVFVLFTAISVLRYAWIFWTALRGPEAADTALDDDPAPRKDFSE